MKGIHYFLSNNHKIDFRESVDNYYRNIIYPLQKMGHKIFLFGLTYESEFIEELKKVYNFSDIVILPKSIITSGKSSWECQLDFHIKTVEILLQFEEQNNIEFSNIILTRFDLFFYDSILTHNIDYEKINVAFKHTSGNCDDNYWIFPRSFINEFGVVCHILKINKLTTHHFNKYINEEFINYMYTVDSLDDPYKYWKFMRINNSLWSDP